MKAKQKYIPVELIEKANKLSKKLSNTDYFSLGFLSPPSENDVIKKALIIGLMELEKQVSIDSKKYEYLEEETHPEEKSIGKSNSLNTPTFEQNKQEKLDKNTKMDGKKQDLRNILGDFL